MAILDLDYKKTKPIKDMTADEKKEHNRITTKIRRAKNKIKADAKKKAKADADGAPVAVEVKVAGLSKQHSDNINRIFNQIYKRDIKFGDDADIAKLKDHDLFSNEIEKRSKEKNTQKTYFSAFASICKLKMDMGLEQAYKIYSDASSRLNVEYIAGRNKNLVKANFTQWEHILEKTARVEDTTERALVAIYTLIPPRRLVYYEVRLGVVDDGKKNLILMDGETPTKIILNRYKTSKTYGSFVFELDKEDERLQQILKEYILSKGLKQGDPLFPNKSGKQHGQTGFSKLITDTFTKIVGKDMGNTQLRESYATYSYAKRAMLSNDEITMEALRSGHSISEQSRYRKVVKQTLK